MNANSLQVLRPYKDQGSWVFDDPSVGLVREPFVFGIDEMIGRMVASIPNADKGFRLLFATQPFPGHAAKERVVRGERFRDASRAVERAEGFAHRGRSRRADGQSARHPRRGR